MNHTTDIFEMSRAALGTPEACAAVQSVSARANCRGPHGTYITEIHSARDGRVRFQQTWSHRNPVCIIINAQGAWATDLHSRESDALDALSVSMIRGHEFQMLPLTLRARYTQPEYAGRVEWHTEPCVQVRARDDLGVLCAHYFRARDARWLGMELGSPRHPEEKTRVLVQDWTQCAHVFFPSRVLAADARGEYFFEFQEIRVNDTPDDFFEAPRISLREAHAV